MPSGGTSRVRGSSPRCCCRLSPEAAMYSARFNPDELAVQALAGGGPRSSGGIRASMAEQHRGFFEQLPYLFVNAIDATGWPLATLMTGRPGFVQAPDSV